MMRLAEQMFVWGWAVHTFGDEIEQIERTSITGLRIALAGEILLQRIFIPAVGVGAHGDDIYQNKSVNENYSSQKRRKRTIQWFSCEGCPHRGVEAVGGGRISAVQSLHKIVRLNVKESTNSQRRI